MDFVVFDAIALRDSFGLSRVGALRHARFEGFSIKVCVRPGAITRGGIDRVSVYPGDRSSDLQKT